MALVESGFETLAASRLRRVRSEEVGAIPL